VPSFCGRKGAIVVRSDTLNNPEVRTDLGYRPSRQQPGSLEHIDLPVNDFVLLAAIGPILRQFSVPSGLRTNHAVSARELPMTIEHAQLNQL
jgi:hypothetical protein